MLFRSGSARHGRNEEDVAGRRLLAEGIAEVEEIVPVGTIDPNFIHTPGCYVDYLVQAHTSLEDLGTSASVSSSKKVDDSRMNMARRAFKELKKIFPESTYSISASIEYLSNLIKDYDSYKTKNLINFIEFLQNLLNSSITKVTRGKVKQFYVSTNYSQLSACVSIPDDMSLNKTIHKSKGDEFNNVLLILDSHKKLDFILSPRLIDDEEHRIRYVAVSRAKERIFISMPSLAVAGEQKFLEHFEIVRC